MKNNNIFTMDFIKYDAVMFLSMNATINDEKATIKIIGNAFLFVFII